MLDWILAGFLCALFLAAGAIKFLRPDGNARDASRWNVSVELTHAVGAAELVAAPLLLVPITRPWMAAFLTLVMVGAIGMQVRVRGWKEIIHPTVTLGLLAWVLIRST